MCICFCTYKSPTPVCVYVHLHGCMMHVCVHVHTCTLYVSACVLHPLMCPRVACTYTTSGFVCIVCVCVCVMCVMCVGVCVCVCVGVDVLCYLGVVMSAHMSLRNAYQTQPFPPPGGFYDYYFRSAARMCCKKWWVRFTVLDHTHWTVVHVSDRSCDQ